MNKKTIIMMMLALVTMAGQAQTKTATVTGYSPALKDGTLVLAGTGTIGNVVDTIQAGHFAFTLPVEELTESFLGLIGEGCPNFNLTLFLRPGVTVKVTGNDCFYPLWKVESPLSEQQTESRITEHCRATNGHPALTACGRSYDPCTMGHIHDGKEHSKLPAYGAVKTTGKDNCRTGT